MAWIKMVNDEEARGLLAQIFDAARKRAGRVWNILRIQSLNPPVLQSSLDIYLRIMHGESPLTRGLREMIATVVSRANHCHY